MAKKSNTGAIVVGSLAGLAFLSVIVAAVANVQKAQTTGTTPTAGGILDDSLEVMKVSLGIPSSTGSVTAPSGRTYQTAVWQALGKQAVLVTCLNPKTVVAVQRDIATNAVSKLAESYPDDQAKADVTQILATFGF